MGHAIVSPGWRMTWDGVREVYCRARVAPSDLNALQGLARTAHGAYGDWRLEDGAESLVRLVRAENGTDTEPENSLFNRTNPSYLLKGGCLD